MAIQVILYQMDKRQNSTRRPAGSGNPYQCEIKDASSVINPSLIFNFGQSDYPSGFNYVQIPVFENRCYWITDWTYYRGTWQATCRVDPLASWRADIGNSTQYILRSSAAYNSNVVDSLYPTMAGCNFYKAAPLQNKAFSGQLAAGRYILGCISKGNNGFGSTSYYVMSSSVFRSFCSYLLSNTDYLALDAEEISADLAKTLFNPFQYVISCMWIPFQFPVSEGFITSTIPLGWWDTELSGSAYLVEQGYDVGTVTNSFVVTKHPQADTGGAYLNLQPYSRYTLYYPPFGEIELDGNALLNAQTVYCKTYVDAYTGMGYLHVSTDDPGAGMANNIIAVRQAQVGVQVPLAQISLDTIDSVGELVSAPLRSIYGAIKGGIDGISAALGTSDPDSFDNFASTVSSIGSGVADAVASGNIKMSVKGGAGSVAVYDTDPYLMLQTMYQVETDNADRGRPLCAPRQISTIPGYILCADPHMACHATSSELRAIEQAMASGFFYE